MYKYYITTLHEGCIKGTDDKQLAYEASEVEECFVLEVETGKWISYSIPVVIEEYK